MSDVIRVMDILLAALVVELDASGTAEKVCTKAIYPGDQVPLDYINDECSGMAWVRLVSAFPTESFPTPVQSVDNCAYTLGFSVEMALFRAAPIPEVFGKEFDLPGDEEHISAAHRQFQDMDLMHRAIKRAQKDIDLMVLGTYTPVGPTGGAVGGTWGLTAGMDDF